MGIMLSVAEEETEEDSESRRKQCIVEGARDEPLILSSMKCSYYDLAKTIRLMDFSDATDGVSDCSERGRIMSLSPDLMREVIRFLIVEPVHQSEVTKIENGGRRHSLFSPPSPYCLLPTALDKKSRWMAPPFTYMPSLLEGAAAGGCECVQFQLCVTGTTCRRLSSVSIKVSSPLPFLGPLISILEFELLKPRRKQYDTVVGNESDENNTKTVPLWTRVGYSTFSVVNRTGWQRFELRGDPVDLKEVRMVCLRRNQSQDRYNATTTPAAFRLYDDSEYDDDDTENEFYYSVKFE